MLIIIIIIPPPISVEDEAGVQGSFGKVTMEKSENWPGQQNKVKLSSLVNKTKVNHLHWSTKQSEIIFIGQQNKVKLSSSVNKTK